MCKLLDIMREYFVHIGVSGVQPEFTSDPPLRLLLFEWTHIDNNVNLIKELSLFGLLWCEIAIVIDIIPSLRRSETTVAIHSNKLDCHDNKLSRSDENVRPRHFEDASNHHCIVKEFITIMNVGQTLKRVQGDKQKSHTSFAVTKNVISLNRREVVA